MKQITGSSNYQGLFGGGGADDLENEDDGQGEALEDNDLMDNAKMSYEVFVMTKSVSTSHSVQWLPYQEQDEEYS